jgi:hypothetical protein
VTRIRLEDAHFAGKRCVTCVPGVATCAGAYLESHCIGTRLQGRGDIERIDALGLINAAPRADTDHAAVDE